MEVQSCIFLASLHSQENLLHKSIVQVLMFRHDSLLRLRSRSKNFSEMVIQNLDRLNQQGFRQLKRRSHCHCKAALQPHCPQKGCWPWIVQRQPAQGHQRNKSIPPVQCTSDIRGPTTQIQTYNQNLGTLEGYKESTSFAHLCSFFSLAPPMFEDLPPYQLTQQWLRRQLQSSVSHWHWYLTPMIF